MLEVRPRRLRLLVIAAVGFAASAAILYWTPPPAGHLENLLRGVLFGVLIGPAVSLGGYAVSKSYLSFDPIAGTIRGPSLWRHWGVAPRRGFERIEYSVYDARIYEVAANGKRRRLQLWPWFADPKDWAALVDMLPAGDVNRGKDESPAS